MTSFVGWAPTIVGRVAFSRVGNDLAQHPEICNLTSRPDGFLFGREQRTSPDGPLPAWALRPFRQPDQLFSIFMEVAAAELPKPTNGSGAVELVRDERGMLSGELYFFSKSALSKECGVDRVLAEIGNLAHRARSPRASDAEKRRYFEEGRERSMALFDRLVTECRQGALTPAFARARINLDRTGRCQVDLDADDLYINRITKLAHRSGKDTEVWQSAVPNFERAAKFISRHAYNVVRGLSHKHYHHHHHADLLATTYPWSPSDDQTWRRETLYGLTRMAIEIRRRGSAKAFKQCAGVVAYAEAFQLHLGSWILGVDGRVADAPTAPPYDFAALRSSIDASLKVRELEDAERRQTILYLTTIVLAALALVVAGVRAAQPVPDTAFSEMLAWMTQHPFLTIGAAAFTGWFLDLAFLRAALAPPATRLFYYGIKRATAAAMGSLIWRGFSSFWSYLTALAVLLLLVLVAGGLSGLAMYFAYSRLVAP